MRRLKTLSSFGRLFGCLAVGRSGRPLGSFGFGFLRLFLCGLMTSGGASFVCVSLAWVGRFVLCFPTALRVTCCGRLLVRVSTLLLLRAVYCLYIPALRNLTGFWRAIIRIWITSTCGQNLIVYGGLYVL